MVPMIKNGTNSSGTAGLARSYNQAIREVFLRRYQILTYRFGGWVLVEISSGQEIFVFGDKAEAEEACLYLNEEGAQNSGQDTRKKH